MMFEVTGKRGVRAMAGRGAMREAGMTLIEILVVLTLIGVVLGIVGSNYLGKSEQAKAKAAKIEIEQISQSLDLFKLELGRYPTTQEGLQALVQAPPEQHAAIQPPELVGRQVGLEGRVQVAVAVEDRQVLDLEPRLERSSRHERSGNPGFAPIVPGETIKP